jgi:putative ABC transport system permease protein
VDHVLAIHVKDSRRYPQNTPPYGAIRDWLRAQPGFVSLTSTRDVAMAFPASALGTTSYKPVDGPSSAFWRQLDDRSVDLAYFTTLGVPLIGGRAFTEADTGRDSRNVIVTASTARLLWPGESALGKRLYRASQGLRNNQGKPINAVVQVVGVVDDVVERAMGGPRAPVIYVATSRVCRYGDCLLLARTTGPASALIVPAQQAVRQFAPDLQPPRVTTLAAAYGDQVVRAVGLAAAASSFAILALVLASIGLAGIIGFSVANRTKEIGIRIALGSGRRRIVGLFVRQGLVTTVLGVAFGLPLTVAVMSFAPSTEAGSGVLVASGIVAEVVLLCVATFACWVPARRAARVDPMVALRAE